MGPSKLGWLLLLILSLIWGSSFILIKKGLVVFSADEVGALRIFSAALFLLPLAVKQLRKVKKEQWKYLFFVGMVGSFLPAFLFAKAQTRIDSAMAGVLNALTPLFTFLVGAVFYHQNLYKQIIAGIFLGFAGTVILVLAGQTGDFKTLNYYGIFVVIATICYGLNVNLIKFKIHGLTALTITSISLTLVGPISLVYLISQTQLIDKLREVQGAWLSFGAIALLGVMGTAIALVLFNRLIQLTTPVFSSSVTYLIPIVALLWGIWDGEIIQLTDIFGMVMILSGVFLANKKT